MVPATLTTPVSIPGSLVTHTCSYYGRQVRRNLGTLDVRKSGPDFERYNKWSKKYHPKYFFGTYSSTFTLDSDFCGGVVWDVWVPTATDNPDWIAQPGSEYYNVIEGIAERSNRNFPRLIKEWGLPVAISEKDIETWLQHSAFLLVDPQSVDTQGLILRQPCPISRNPPLIP